MQFSKRTNTCGELRLTDSGKAVTLNGWVSQLRDLGGVIFINLRDRYGITQITVNSDNKAAVDIAKSLGLEYVISASGTVQKRSSANPNMETGEVEVLADKIEILNTSETTPFVVEEDVKASEELRFKYRYLDLRRKKIGDNLVLRSQVYNIVHRYFEREKFIEVETPILMKSTPEGARDYLVPSRVHKGKFYALPQSPQTYKQILMVSGLDRYVQICKCFRDEDLRADRQPEFTQIDLEMSFVGEKDVFKVVEGVIRDIWKETKGIELPDPFPIMSYDEAMAVYGSDKPDLRIKGELKISDLTEIVKATDFKVFTDAINAGGIVAGLRLPAQDVTRKIIDQLTDYVKTLKFGGLGYIKYNADGTASSPMFKFLSEDIQSGIKSRFSAEPGDTVFILSGGKSKVLSGLGNLRLRLAEIFNLVDESRYEFLWVNDFPLFGYDEDSDTIVAEHHAFTMPHDSDMEKLTIGSEDPKANVELLTSIRATCYDMVCNGSEFGSGSIRIHRSDIQEKVFNVLALTKEEQELKFGFLLGAFKYGAPPHGGFALGFDRIIATLCGTKDIRETIAFPKTTSAVGLMDNSPSDVDARQRKELSIYLEEEYKKLENEIVLLKEKIEELEEVEETGITDTSEYIVEIEKYKNALLDRGQTITMLREEITALSQLPQKIEELENELKIFKGSDNHLIQTILKLNEEVSNLHLEIRDENIKRNTESVNQKINREELLLQVEELISYINNLVGSKSFLTLKKNRIEVSNNKELNDRLLKAFTEAMKHAELKKDNDF